MNQFQSQFSPESTRQLAAAVGGAALAVGALVAAGRMEGNWADFPLLLLLLLPCVALLGLAVQHAGAHDGLHGWQSTYLVGGLLLLVPTLFQLFLVLGEDDPGSATSTVIFTAVAVVAWALAVWLDSPISALIAALSAVGAGLALLVWLNDDAGTTAFRNILLVEGVVLLLAARLQQGLRPQHSHLLVAVGGLVLIAAGVVGALGDRIGDGEGVLGGVMSLEGAPSGGEDSSEGWELVVLATTLAMVAYTAWQQYRGSGYIAIVGAVAFGVLTIGEGSLWGWPFVLGLIAAGGIAYGRGAGPAGAGAAPTASNAPTAQTSHPGDETRPG